MPQACRVSATSVLLKHVCPFSFLSKRLFLLLSSSPKRLFDDTTTERGIFVIKTVSQHRLQKERLPLRLLLSISLSFTLYSAGCVWFWPNDSGVTCHPGSNFSMNHFQAMSLSNLLFFKLRNNENIQEFQTKTDVFVCVNKRLIRQMHTLSEMQSLRRCNEAIEIKTETESKFRSANPETLGHVLYFFHRPIFPHIFSPQLFHFVTKMSEEYFAECVHQLLQLF